MMKQGTKDTIERTLTWRLDRHPWLLTLAAQKAHGVNGKATQVATRVEKAHGVDIAQAIDRAMHDLSALIGELIAETRKELRKELGA